jgi:flavodoxin
MKALVIYYSRSGNTIIVGKDIAEALRADDEEIVSFEKYKGFFGYIRSGYEAIFKRKSDIAIMLTKVSEYDLVVLGSPNWGGMASPVRTFISENDLKKVKKIAFFCVQGGSGAEKVLSQIEKLTKKPINTLIINAKDIGSRDYKNKIKEFCSKLKKK